MGSILAAILAFQTITVAIDGAPASTVVPESLIKVKGQHWTDAFAYDPNGADSLAGYTVTLGGSVCPIVGVNADHIACLAPSVENGTRTLIVSGPAGAFSSSVEVVTAYPIIVERDGYAVASSANNFYPQYFFGTPIPVSPSAFNYIGIQVRGVQAGSLVQVSLDGPEHHSIPAMAYLIPGQPGVVSVLFFSPPCLNGTYAVTLSVSGVESAPSLIKFSSDCAVRRVEGFSRPRVLR